MEIMDSKPRILITGGTGYIGSNVMKYLKDKGFEVDNLSREDDHEYIFEHYKPEIVLHFATFFSNLDTLSDMRNFKKSNISFGMEVAHYASIHKVKTFVNFTTFQLHYNDEEYNPVNLYAATKKAFMDILEYYHQAGKFKVINVELNSVYGPWDKRPKLIPILLQSIKTGKEVVLSNLEKVVDLINIKDIFTVVNNIIKGSFTANYFVITGRNISIKELIVIIENLSGHKINLKINEYTLKREINNPVWNFRTDDYIIYSFCIINTLEFYLESIIDNEEYYADLS